MSGMGSNQSTTRCLATEKRMNHHRIHDLGGRIEAAMRRHGINPGHVRNRLTQERIVSAVATAKLCNEAVRSARALGPKYLRSYAAAVADAAGGSFS